MNKTILLVYGSGGHNEQMKRIYNSLKDISCIEDKEFISLCDNDVKNIITNKYYMVKSVTDKFSYFNLFLKLPKKLISIFKILKKIKQENPNLYYIISTGPGISIITSFYFKIFFKTKIIHIETWSRFYSKSLTGRFMYYLADEFFIQNKELLELYPNARYEGRL